jgi:hypothetical protein
VNTFTAETDAVRVAVVAYDCRGNTACNGKPMRACLGIVDGILYF